MVNLRKFIEKINSAGKFTPVIRFGEPMSRHTTFKVGGKADAWIRPGKEIFPAYAAKLLKAAGEEDIPVFILGSGANIVVSDKGIRGIVLDTGAYRGVGKREEITTAESEKPRFSVSVLSGTSVDGLTSRLAERGLSGLEFLSGMPGTVGGAVWMNARCYEKSVSDTLLETEILDEEFKRIKIPFNAEDFSYKKSPFQTRNVLILSARFAVQFGLQADIRRENECRRLDRTEKGHYRYPSAGSAFKNNHDFGSPTGKIIDMLGLRGLSSGGAQVAPWHGNIIINTGNATATDIRNLMNEIARRVKELRGFDLESEILFVGDWE
ncbi:MAG: UDP-N-acetylmuramate dehydrogenase [Treponema sp.]|nr:UDP-N-acetylmuramate dehydrogenase [Treponema sp.]